MTYRCLTTNQHDVEYVFWETQSFVAHRFIQSSNMMEANFSDFDTVPRSCYLAGRKYCKNWRPKKSCDLKICPFGIATFLLVCRAMSCMSNGAVYGLRRSRSLAFSRVCSDVAFSFDMLDVVGRCQRPKRGAVLRIAAILPQNKLSLVGWTSFSFNFLSSCSSRTRSAFTSTCPRNFYSTPTARQELKLFHQIERNVLALNEVFHVWKEGSDSLTTKENGSATLDKRNDSDNNRIASDIAVRPVTANGSGVDWLKEETLEILDENIYPIGSLSMDDVAHCEHLMSGWVFRRSVHAAKYVERLLKRLVDDIKAGNSEIRIGTPHYVHVSDLYENTHFFPPELGATNGGSHFLCCRLWMLGPEVAYQVLHIEQRLFMMH
jgi:hypothetical protein